MQYIFKNNKTASIIIVYNMGKKDFILLNPQLEKTFIEICNRIRRLQSGGTIDSLQRIGATTTGQIGASYVSLKTLASEYLPDEKLATLLWKQQKREEQIVACFLFPSDINKEKITQFAETCNSYEIAGYFGSIFLCHHGELAEIVSDWSGSGKPFLQVAALSGAARHLLVSKNKSQISEERFKQLVNRSYSDKYVELVAQRYRFNI